MAANHTRTKAGLAFGAGAAVIWGSLYFSANQSFPAVVQTSAGATTSSGTTSAGTASTGATVAAAAQGSSMQQPAQAIRVRRTRRS